MQTSPPVLPCLQKIGNEDGKKELIIDGWNCWYFRDLDQLVRVNLSD